MNESLTPGFSTSAPTNISKGGYFAMDHTLWHSDFAELLPI